MSGNPISQKPIVSFFSCSIFGATRPSLVQVIDEEHVILTLRLVLIGHGIQQEFGARVRCYQYHVYHPQTDDCLCPGRYFHISQVVIKDAGTGKELTGIRMSD